MTQAQIEQVEAAISRINQLRATRPISNNAKSKWATQWHKAHVEAAKALGVKASIKGNEQWNRVVRALDRYRPDWRGYTVNYVWQPSDSEEVAA